MTNPNSSVYFAQVGRYVKIGVSINVPQRLRSIQRPSSWAFPPDLRTDIKPRLIGTLPGDRHREYDIQCDLWEWRVAGEWFEATPEVLALIDGLLAEAAA